MKRVLCALAILTVWVLFLAPAVWGQEYALDEESYKVLSADAAKAYTQGVKQLDHVDYAEAFKSFQEAAERDPAHVGIRFVLAKLAAAEARKKTGKGADDLLGVAETAYKDILAMKGKGVGLADVQRAERSLAVVEKARGSVTARDARLERVGSTIILERAKELYVGDVERAQKEAAQKAQETATRATAPRRSGGARSGASDDEE